MGVGDGRDFHAVPACVLTNGWLVAASAPLFACHSGAADGSVLHQHETLSRNAEISDRSATDQELGEGRSTPVGSHA